MEDTFGPPSLLGINLDCVHNLETLLNKWNVSTIVSSDGICYSIRHVYVVVVETSE